MPAGRSTSGPACASPPGRSSLAVAWLSIALYGMYLATVGVAMDA